MRWIDRPGASDADAGKSRREIDGESSGSSAMNTSLSVVGGQVPDFSNPTPSGIPAARPALH
jgi:hypothetical protein